MTKFVIARKSPATGRTLYLTGSRAAGVSFEAPGNTACGVGVANLKTWTTEAGAHRWLKTRPDMLRAYAAAGLVVTVEKAN